MASETKQQKLDGTSNVQAPSIVWLDSGHGTSVENIAFQEQLRALDSEIQILTDESECDKHIKTQSNQACIVLIVNGGLGQKLVPTIHSLSQIISIYVFCGNREFHKKWADAIPKVKDVVTDFNDLKYQVEMNHFKKDPPAVDPSINDEASTGISEPDNRFRTSDICVTYLSQIKETPKDKEEFVLLRQTDTTDKSKRKELIKEFEEKYSPDQALSWFNRDPFISEILYKAFQSADVETIYRYRFLIRDIQKQFQQHKCTTTVQVFRGELTPIENIERLKTAKGKIIAIKTFFLANLKRTIATAHIRIPNEKKKQLLFDIEADPQTEGVKPFIKTASFPDSKDKDEVMFMLGSLFKINEIQEEGGITVVKMALCANDNDNPFKDRLKDTNEEKDHIGFAQLLCNISPVVPDLRILNKIDDLEKHLSEISADHPDCIRCYDTLGTVSFAKQDIDASLSWYQKSLELKEKKSPPNISELDASYGTMAYIYSYKKDNTKALDAYKHMLIIRKQIHGDDNRELIYCYTEMIKIYESDGKFTDVLSCYFQISSIMLKQHPVDDMNFAVVYNNIGKTFTSLCQYPLALGYYETSLKIKLKNSSAPSDSTALTYKGIGMVHKYMGNVSQARTNFEKAADMYGQLYSPAHWTVAEMKKYSETLSSTSQ